ncbi:hypothetical protein TWF103_001916 [Orbilia oligospora]|nr:hypothetical protein TWF103_001916 [Orbilia oligospora]
MYRKLAVGLLFMGWKANSYSEDFPSHIAASSQRSLQLPFLDTVSYEMEDQFTELAIELGDFHEQHEFMRPEYFSGKAPKPVYVRDRDNVERFFKEVHKDLMRRTDRFLTMMEWVDVVRQTWRLFQTEKLLLEQFLEILLRDVDKEKARLRRDRADLIPLVNFDIYESGSTYV